MITDLEWSAINCISLVHSLPFVLSNTFLLSLQPSKTIFPFFIFAADLIFCFSEKTEAIVKDGPQAPTTAAVHPPASRPHTQLPLLLHV